VRFDNPDHSRPGSGEVVFLCTASARRKRRFCRMSRVSSGMLRPWRGGVLPRRRTPPATHGGIQQTSHTGLEEGRPQGFVDRRRDAERRGRSGERAHRRLRLRRACHSSTGECRWIDLGSRVGRARGRPADCSCAQQASKTRAAATIANLGVCASYGNGLGQQTVVTSPIRSAGGAVSCYSVTFTPSAPGTAAA
jgi:hypothetical protein